MCVRAFFSLATLLTDVFSTSQIESTIAAARADAVHVTPEGSSCCQLTPLRSVLPTSTVVEEPSTSMAAAPPPSQAEYVQRSPQSARSNSRTQSPTVAQQSATDSRQTTTGNKRTGTKSFLPLTKSSRPPGSGRRTHQRSPVESQSRQHQHQHQHHTDDMNTISSSSDAYSDDTTASSANGHTSTSPTPGK